MLFAFIDEHENKIGQLNYTSATAAVFDASFLIDFRRDLILGLSDLMFGCGRDPSKIERMPILHASNMPKLFSADQILQTYDLIFGLSNTYGVKIFRAGYFDQSLINPFKSREQRIEFCLVNIVWPVQSIADTEIIYVYEMNHAVHKKMKSYNDTYMQNIYWQSESIRKSVSIKNYENISGKFYCDKENHHMYVADFVGYALSQRDKPNRTPFQEIIASKCEILRDAVLYDSITYMNDSSRSVNNVT